MAATLTVLGMAGAATAQDEASAQSASATATPIDDVTKGDKRRERRERREKAEAATTEAATAEAATAEAIIAEAAAAIDAGATPTSDVHCRTIKVTGTRMSKRICATEAQWNSLDANGEEGVREMRRRSTDTTTQAPPDMNPFGPG